MTEKERRELIRYAFAGLDYDRQEHVEKAAKRLREVVKGAGSGNHQLSFDGALDAWYAVGRWLNE